MSIAINSETTRPLHPDAVRILPLGGLGEIGLNMMVIEAAGGLLIIDCGLMFPEAYMLGIDLVIPDIAAIAERGGIHAEGDISGFSAIEYAGQCFQPEVAFGRFGIAVFFTFLVVGGVFIIVPVLDVLLGLNPLCAVACNVAHPG